MKLIQFHTCTCIFVSSQFVLCVCVTSIFVMMLETSFSMPESNSWRIFSGFVYDHSESAGGQRKLVLDEQSHQQHHHAHVEWVRFFRFLFYLIYFFYHFYIDWRSTRVWQPLRLLLAGWKSIGSMFYCRHKVGINRRT